MRNGLRLGALSAVAGIAVALAGSSTTTDVVATVRAAIQRQAARPVSDKSLASALRKFVLTEKLDERFVEELESEGAGPEAVRQLETLREASAKLPAPEGIPPFASPARPSVDEQRAFFKELNQNALHYSRSLPNFICTEVVRRYQLAESRQSDGRTSRGSSPSPISLIAGFAGWRQMDTLAVKLTYFDNHEKYQLISVNGKKSNKAYDTVGGAISEGDFGSTLLEIFSPESKTQFHWDHWTHLRKRLTRVYAYSTKRENSHYKIAVGEAVADRRTVTAGRHGFVYGDDQTHMVVRVSGEAENIPAGFPVIAQSGVLDYDFADVGGQKFLVPLRADVRMRTRQIQFKNVLEFTEYRKFTGESSISFDVPVGTDMSEPPKPIK